MIKEYQKEPIPEKLLAKRGKVVEELISTCYRCEGKGHWAKDCAEASSRGHKRLQVAELNQKIIHMGCVEALNQGLLKIKDYAKVRAALQMLEEDQKKIKKQ